MSRIDFFFDFETRSKVSLKSLGAVAYALHPSTEPTLLTWCYGRTGKVHYWHPPDPLPKEVVDVLRNPSSYNLIAWNIEFDFLIWSYKFAPKYNIPWVRPKIEDLTDAAALSKVFRTGGSLNEACTWFALPKSKDANGRTSMLKQARYVELNPEEKERFIHYGIWDTKLLRDLYYLLPKLDAREQFLYEWTLRMNLKGIRVDEKLLNAMAVIILEQSKKLMKEWLIVTENQIRTPNSPFCLKFFKGYFPAIKDMKAHTVRGMLKQTQGVPDNVVRALNIKAMLSSSSLAKVTKALTVKVNGRIYDILNFHQAHTKRWAGKGIQIQNFPRADAAYIKHIKCIELNTKEIKLPDYHENPLKLVKNLLRRIWLPDDYLAFYCGDFSKIEPVVLRWLLGLPYPPKDIYEQMTSMIYGIPAAEVGKDSEERVIGKAAELGCGYGLGGKGFQKQVFEGHDLDIGLEAATQAVNAYRRKYPQVLRAWKLLERAMHMATSGKTCSLFDGKVYVSPLTHKFYGEKLRSVEITTISGSKLYYHGVDYRPHLGMFTPTYIDAYGGRLSDPDNPADRKRINNLYGGKLMEHVVSSIARDVLASSLYRCEEAGWKIINSVHDELWALGVPGQLEQFKSVMQVSPGWAKDLIIKADCIEGHRYLK